MPTNKSYIGAIVQYCGHRGTFVADLIQVGSAVAVRASGPVTMENLNRNPLDYERATHTMVDFPVGGVWMPLKGFFVVPGNQVKILREHK
jgi:hypothetical protein